MNGKGDKRRQEDANKVRLNWDLIKWKSKPVDATKEDTSDVLPSSSD